MDKVIGASIAAALIILAFTFMTLAWRARTRRAHDYATWPELQGELNATVEVFYVATTQGANSLERVSLKGFSYRGYANLEVFDDGLQVRLTTKDVLAIPAHSLLSYEFAQVAIDKAVEKEGLIGFTWQTAAAENGTRELTTFIRLRDPRDRNDLTQIFTKLVGTTTKEEAV